MSVLYLRRHGCEPASWSLFESLALSLPQSREKNAGIQHLAVKENAMRTHGGAQNLVPPLTKGNPRDGDAPFNVPGGGEGRFWQSGVRVHGGHLNEACIHQNGSTVNATAKISGETDDNESVETDSELGSLISSTSITSVHSTTDTETNDLIANTMDYE